MKKIFSQNENQRDLFEFNNNFSLGILIVNNDYDYLMNSKDSLRQKYINTSILFSILEGLGYIIMIFMNGSESIIIISIITLIELSRLIIYKPLFSPYLMKISLIIQILLFSFSLLTYAFIKINSIPIHCFGICVLSLLPFSIKVGNQIDLIIRRRSLFIFEKQLFTQNRVNPEVLNYEIRMNKFERSFKKKSNFQEIQKTNRVLARTQNLMERINQEEIKISQRQRQAGIHLTRTRQQQQQEYWNENMRWNFQSFEEKVVDGQTYVLKDQVYGDNDEMEQILENMFKDLFQMERNSKRFGIGDIYYLIFIVEVLKNYQLFELTTTQIQKNVSLKQAQMLSTIRREVEQQKELIKIISDEEQLYDFSYYEALMFDEQIQLTQKMLEDLIQQKLEVLMVMKQRHINLEELQNHLEKLVDGREQLKKSIILMIKINEYNLKLYDIYLNYLEALSFSESDIKLEQYNRYQNNQSHIYFQMNANDSCILFASLKSQNEIKIIKLSNNFSSFLGYKNEELLCMPIEKIMPEIYSKHHHKYTSNFFENGEQISRKNGQLFFTQTKSGYIIPISIDIKVNLLVREKDFGITAYFQRINKSNQYILLDSTNSKLISMTIDLHQFVFSSLKSLNKVNLINYFPFLIHFRHGGQDSSQHPNSVKSQGTIHSGHNISSQQSFKDPQQQNEQVKVVSINQTEQKNELIFCKKQTFINSKEINASKVKKNENQKVNTFQSQRYSTFRNVQQNAIQREVLLKRRLNQKEINQPIQYQNKQQQVDPQIVDSENQLKTEEYEEFDERKYKDLQYLLVILKGSVNSVSKSKRAMNLDDYQFFTMIINYCSTTQDLNNLKYIEITNIKQISPIHNQRLISQVYNQEIDHFQSNLSNFKTSDIQILLQELEFRSKDSNRSSLNKISNRQVKEFDSQIIQSQIPKEQDQIFENIYEQNIINKDYQGLILYNRYSQDFSPSNFQLQNRQKLEDQKRKNQDNSFNKQSFSYQKEVSNELLDSTIKNLIGKENFQHDETKNFHDSSLQYIKLQTNETSQNKQFEKTTAVNSSFLGNNSLPQNVLDNKRNILSKANTMNYQSMVSQAAVFLPQSSIFPEQILPSAINILYPMTPEDEQQNVNIQAFPLYAQLGSNQDVNIPAKKHLPESSQFFSPKLSASSNLLHNAIKNSGILSPQINSSSNINLFEKPIDQFSKQFSKLTKQVEKKFPEQESAQDLTQKKKQIDALKKNNIKNLKDALENQSNRSRDSSSSSSKKSTKSIILQRYTLGIMKFINIIGFISFSTVIGVMLEQYFSMINQFNTFNYDLKFVNWSNSYSNSLCEINQSFNLYQLISQNKISSLTLTEGSQMTLDSIQNMLNSLEDMRVLLISLQEASPDRQIVQRMLSSKFSFSYGSLLDRNKSIVGQSSENFYNLVDFNDSLYISTFTIFESLVKFSHFQGTTARYVAINNSDELINALTQVTSDGKDFSLSELSSLKSSVDQLLIIICLVTGASVFVIIPVYSFIQMKREQFIQLFGTFNSGFLDTTILEIHKILQKQTSSKSLNILKFNQDNQKRQNLSSTTSLHKISFKIIFSALFIYCITLPYPILDNILPTNYIEQNQEVFPILGEKFNLLLDVNIFIKTESLYRIQSFLLKESSFFLFCLSLKYGIDSIPQYSYDQFKDSLQTYLNQGTEYQSDLLAQINGVLNLSMYDQSTFEGYFLKMFDGDICTLQFQYIKYLDSGYTFNQISCTQVMNGIMKKGISLSINLFLEQYSNLHQVMQINNDADFQSQFHDFQDNVNFSEFIKFQEYLVEALEGLSNFLKEESKNHKNFLQIFLTGLLLYQFAVLILIFNFGWIVFYNKMNNYMHKTKFYLAVLNVTYLVQNPYVQNYLHNNMS